jgi:hypothetical protein
MTFSANQINEKEESDDWKEEMDGVGDFFVGISVDGIWPSFLG